MLDDEFHADRPGQVDDHIALVCQFVDDELVQHGTVHEPQPRVGPDGVQVGQAPGRQVIQGNDRVTAGQQRLDQVRPDEATAAGYQVCKSSPAAHEPSRLCG